MKKLALGPWNSDDFAATVNSNTGAGADAGLPPEIRFLAAVSKLVRLRQSGPNAAGDLALPAVFLLHTSSPETMPSAKREPMLNNGLTMLNGRLWFVNAPVVMGHYIETEQTDDDSLFNMVEQLGFSSVPAIIFDPRLATPEVRFYAAGLGDPEECKRYDLSGGNLTMEKIRDVISHIHAQRIATPEVQSKPGKMWEDSDKYWVIKDAEDRIQMYLVTGLTAAFPTTTVRMEQTQVTGRLDIEIEEPDPIDRSKFTRHAILELKVLRSFGSTGNAVSAAETEEWIKSGVEQAAAYRMERKALASALCCFDMRQTDTGEACFTTVSECAKELCVSLWRWFIYSKSKILRSAITSA
jgi:hypothetical protein